MGNQIQKLLRFLVPGSIILFILLALKETDLNSFTDTVGGISFTRGSMQFWIVPFVLGAIYNIIKLRNVFYLKHINAINNNIRIRLLDSFSDHTELSTYVNQLGWKQLKPVFYKFVDSKPDMKVKADNVRMNGLILSSLADAAILSLIGVPLYVGFYCWKDSLYYLIPLGICLVVFLASYLLLPLARNKHIEYSDEQIDSIISNYKGELEESLMNLTK